MGTKKIPVIIKLGFAVETWSHSPPHIGQSLGLELHFIDAKIQDILNYLVENFRSCCPRERFSNLSKTSARISQNCAKQVIALAWME